MRTSANPTIYRKELKGRILEVAMREFKRKGVRSVKMDDIARILSISKRTLYEIYSDKQELLLEGIRHEERMHDEHISKFASGKGVIDILMEFYRMQINQIGDVNPLFYDDVKKYKMVRDYIRERHLIHQQKGLDFFKKGVKDGYFRDDIDYELISRLAEDVSRLVMESSMYSEYSLEHVFRNIFFLFFRGFSTPKGIEVMDSLLAEER